MAGLFRPNPHGSPVEAGVVGFGFYTATVFDLLAEAGRPARFIVDDRGDGDPDGVRYAAAVRGIPVLDAAAFAGRAKRGAVLYAGRVEATPPADAGPASGQPPAARYPAHSGSDRAFAGRAKSGARYDGREDTPLSPDLACDAPRQIAAWVARACGGPVPVRHPVELLQRVPMPPCPDRYAVFGFPGSGNILTQNLIAGLFGRNPPPAPEGWQMRAGLSEHYFLSTAARVRVALARLAPTHVDFIPHEFGTMMVAVECGPARAGAAFHVPSHRHLGLRTFPTHSRPTRQAVDYFAAAGAPFVAVVRHPCETLLSLANKIARPSRVMLDHPRFLDRESDQLADWTAHLLANRDRVIVVRYEDLVDRRTAALRRLADALGRPVSDGEAADLLDAYLFRNLPSLVLGHFYRGGSDKWRTEFTPDDLRRLLARVPAAAFTAFGYDVPTAADLTAPTAVAAEPMPVNPLNAALLRSFRFHPVPGPHGIHVTGSDREMIDALSAAFQDPDLLALFATGGLAEDGHVPAIYDAA